MGLVSDFYYLTIAAQEARNPSLRASRLMAASLAKSALDLLKQQSLIADQENLSLNEHSEKLDSESIG
jgi:hypothetical protein